MATRRTLYSFLICSLFVCCIWGCRKQQSRQTVNGIFQKQQPSAQSRGNAIERIVNSGEIIIATISSPNTYFDYQGESMGLQYALVKNFAETLGVGVRVELANDTLGLIEKVEKGEVDLVAYPLPQSLIKKDKLVSAGQVNEKDKTSWVVSASATDLAQSLNEWYSTRLEEEIKKAEHTRILTRHEVKRTVHPVFVSREKGIFSIYDNLFKKAASTIGWDWRLLAAQCYQESAFDPNAVSRAGACGLMQIMPATARHQHVEQQQLFLPEHNINAAARCINELQQSFRNIPASERIYFVLAAYNGGIAHIQDAQALTQKYGGNPQKWSDVSFYVSGLSNARYYRDPVVKHGYMIGNETTGYVNRIIALWRNYGGDTSSLQNSRLAPSHSPEDIKSSSATHKHKANRFSTKQQIISPNRSSE